MSLLEVRELEVRYGRVVALSQIALEVAQGEVLTVLGRNGAGKSSLLNALAGDVHPGKGQILWKSQDITRWPADRHARQGIALVPEGRRIFPHLTVRENLRLGGFFLGRTTLASALARVFSLFPVLAERADTAAGRLSGGQQQMLAIGRALMSGAELLLLDEPSLGLAPLFVDEVYAQLQALRDQGLTMILVEQQVQRALEFSDQAIVLNLGQIVLREKPAALLQDPRLVEAYLTR
ncbi:MAG: ABC transporter ATP-binding protein [Chloroflexi bacterium]|nr:ABC transporter ATP-binding protein [Chloroflexota bacterium]MCI0727779.1 ABC transporter ATP-binding protein [Chloroflexota bacterium]